MDDKLLNELLSSAIKRGDVPFELTDAVVDNVLEAHPGDVSDASRARVQWNLKLRIQDAAIMAARREMRDTAIPFGRFIEAVRERAGVTRSAIAERLGKQDEYVQRLERGDLSPMNIPVTEMAQIISVFNVKIASVPHMIVASLAAASAKVTYRAAARSHGGIRHDARGADVERALDAFALRMQQKSKPLTEVDIPSVVQAYVAKIQDELARAGRSDLLV